jgi:hypothetical protein
MVFMRLLGGQIQTAGMLSADGESQPSPERVQLLVGSLYAMGAYGFDAISEFQAARTAFTMPEPSPWLLDGLGGSNALYLAAKTARLFTGRT